MNQVGKLGEYMEGVGEKWVMYDSSNLSGRIGVEEAESCVVHWERL